MPVVMMPRRLIAIIQAQVIITLFAHLAGAAATMRFTRHPIARLEVGHALSQRHNLRREFMSGDKGKVRRPAVLQHLSIEDAGVRPANRNRFHLYQHFTASRMRYRDPIHGEFSRRVYLHGPHFLLHRFRRISFLHAPAFAAKLYGTDSLSYRHNKIASILLSLFCICRIYWFFLLFRHLNGMPYKCHLISLSF